MKKRTKLSDRTLPTYSHGEEIFNMVSHIVGGALGIVATVLCPIVALLHGNIFGVVSGCIFGVSIIILYAMSSIYHGLSPRLMAKKVFQVFDHCTIFILIAGTYTPFCLCTLRQYDATTGWVIFALIWALTAIGIVFNSIDIKNYKVFSMICYILMGWCIIIKGTILPELLTPVGFWLLIGGGIAYTGGAVFYGFGSKKKWLHSVFHIGCVIGTLLHFLCIILYVM